MNKKLVLILLGILTMNFAHNAIASISGLYIKPYIGLGKLHNIKIEKSSKYSAKSKFNTIIGVGVGYIISDIFRGELNYTYLSTPTLKTNFIFTKTVDDVLVKKSEGNVRLNPKISMLLLNIYADIINLSPVNIFLSSGVGAAEVKQKFLISLPNKDDKHLSSKKSYNLAYSIGGGGALTIAPNIKIEIAYQWQNFGKTRSSDKRYYNLPSHRLKAHLISLGLRVDL